MVGSPGEDLAAGMVVLFSDDALAGFALTQSYRIGDLEGVGNGAHHDGAEFGAALASGDFNGDGRDEIAIGAPYELQGASTAGAVYVVPEPIAPLLGAVATLALAALRVTGFARSPRGPSRATWSTRAPRMRRT